MERRIAELIRPAMLYVCTNHPIVQRILGSYAQNIIRAGYEKRAVFQIGHVLHHFIHASPTH